MKVLSKEEVKIHSVQIIDDIKNGAIFIHPTDTIYGIGCDATNEEAVKKIRKLKDRFEMPFSVIAPSKEWIKENCVITKKIEEWLEKLPGPYTLILKLKNKEAIAKSTNMGMDSLGIRIPQHWFSKLAEAVGTPIVTTSANKVGKEFMTSMDNLDSEIKSNVNFIIFEGEKKGTPSQLVNLEKDEVEIKSR